MQNANYKPYLSFLHSRIYNISTIDDKVEALRLYLEANKYDDEGDAWHSIHYPNIVAFVNQFNKVECDRLLASMRTWGEDLFWHMADPFLDIVNPHINGNLLYIKIFLAATDSETEEYLMNNISVVTLIPIGVEPVEFYYRLKDKVICVSKRLGRNEDFTLTQIEVKIGIEETERQ